MSDEHTPSSRLAEKVTDLYDFLVSETPELVDNIVPGETVLYVAIAFCDHKRPAGIVIVTQTQRQGDPTNGMAPADLIEYPRD